MGLGGGEDDWTEAASGEWCPVRLPRGRDSDEAEQEAEDGG